MTYNPYPPNPKRSTAGRTLAIIAGVVVLLCLLGGIALAIAGGDGTNRDPDTAAQDAANRSAAATPTTTPSAARSSAPSAVRVDDGTYTVGEDVPPGRYKATERAGELCYWELTGPAEGDLDNGVGGGFPTFTAKRGQTLQISSCPPFELRK